MSGKADQRPPLFLPAAVLAAVVYAGLWLWPGPAGAVPLKVLAGLCAVLAIVGTFTVARSAFWWAADFRRYLKALGGDETHGDSDWLSEREARKAGLHKRKRGARFAGVLGRTALWLWTETHHLIIGPAGSSKTSAAILNFLASIPESCLINDTKGELCEVTARMRAKIFGHRIVKLDPTDPNSEQVNALDFIHELVSQNLPEALTLLRGMVLQLYPEPPQEGPNKFFRDGTRRALAAVIMAVVVVCPPTKRTLATVYRAFSNSDLLHDLLMQAGSSELLNGEVADMAEDLHRMAFGDEGAAKTYEQFRIGALQALDPFGPGNYLARITAATTFSFTELKTSKVSCYLIVDYTNKDTLGKWSGLMQWLAAYQLVRVGNNQPVNFILDEFCNAPLHKLPDILTLLRSYGVKCVMATQDLADITRVYGKDALETVLSETDIKQFLGGIRSKSTLDYLAAYIGNTTINAPSFSFDESGVRESIGRIAQPLQSADKIRRLDQDSQIILFRNLKAILDRKVPVFAVSPYRKQIGVNSMYGKKRRLMPVMVRVGLFGTTVTRRGRYVVRRRSLVWPVMSYALRHMMPPPAVFLAAVAAIGIWAEGFPHLRVRYAYSGSMGHPTRYHWCEYLGPEPFKVTGGDCPIVVFRKTW